MSTPSKFRTDRELTKSYEPAAFEAEIYRFWEEHGAFEAYDVNQPDQESFCIMIPPPNVTGVLHMGHALTNTIQDILTRWRRMKGDNTLWLPGTDHAGIATQAQVEKHLFKTEKTTSTGKPLTRHDLGRDEFVKRVWLWKDEHGRKIVHQLRRLGSSLDWKRERFTMDEGLSRAVREVFVRLYEENLIYRGERIINWCPRCRTALSDLEVIPTERKSFLWQIGYAVVNDDGSPVIYADGPEKGQNVTLVVSTTRPETLLGDTAVAVHPEDERYQAFHGKKVKLPLLGRLIPIITDAYVDREFGTGVLKVTPAHDFNDYEMGLRHQLPMVTVMGKEGKITSAGGPYAHLKFSEARERVIQDLKTGNLLLKSEDHINKVGLCQRCEQVAEPIISKQWFVKIEPLAQPAIQAVENGSITFTPKSWEKTYFEWMHNIRDWCISRQLWWGHQIPAWYCGVCQEITVSRTTPLKCAHCPALAHDLKQDEDVLDTWFSSALWPFSTLGWPDQTAALSTFYPTDILETGFDIIFFWVARMIMMGLHFMGEVPFKKIYLHAMVRDEKGEKMSKSKGNVIDPLQLIDLHGADSLRFTLAIMAGQGRDIKLSTDRVEGYRAFCNKLWNAVKFFHLQLDPGNGEAVKAPEGGIAKWLKHHHLELLPANRWILSSLQKLILKVEKGLENFELNESSQALYDFTWHELCDWYIEFSKLPLKDPKDRVQTIYTLHFVLGRLLALMHPFMPFVTEELWQTLPWTVFSGKAVDALKARGKNAPRTLMLQSYPQVQPLFQEQDSERTISLLKVIIEALRNFRGENSISPKVEFPVYYIAHTTGADAFIKLHRASIRALAKISTLDPFTGSLDARDPRETAIPLPQAGLELRISLKGLVDYEEERKRIRKEIEKAKSDLLFVREKLGKDTFISKAPPVLVAKEKAREKELSDQVLELDASLERLSKAVEEK